MPGSLPQLVAVGDWGWCSLTVLGCGALVVAGWPLLGGSGYRAWGPGSRGLWLRPFLRGVGLRPLGWGGLSQVRKHTLLSAACPRPRPGCLVLFLCVSQDSSEHSGLLSWVEAPDWVVSLQTLHPPVAGCGRWGCLLSQLFPGSLLTHPHPHTLSLIQHMHA